MRKLMNHLNHLNQSFVESLDSQLYRLTTGIYVSWYPEAYSEPCQTFKMERFAKIFNGL